MGEIRISVGQEKFKEDRVTLEKNKTLVNLQSKISADPLVGAILDEKIQIELRADLSATGQANASLSNKLVGTVLDGKIQIESLIGQGGMSVVYKGRHLVLDRPVAVKVLLPNLGFNEKAVMRLQQEAKSAYSLSHKNLASVHDVSITSDGLPYLVMDFAGGETLSEMLKNGPLEPMKAIEIFSQLCAGLSAAHSQKVIHRDIKPSNIMVEHLANGDELVKIVDFGIAKKVTENADEIQKLTQTGEVFGTPLYMSPEQCRGDKLDQRSDIYSLGCVLYEALTGAPPFKGESAIATIFLHLGQETPTPNKDINLPPALVNVLHRCLDKNSKDRYQSMDELYSDLQAIKEGGKTAKRYVKKRHPNNRIKIVIGAALFSVVMMLLVQYNTFQNSENGYGTIAGCNEKIVHNPKDDYAYFARARLNMAQHDYTKALADFTDCIKVTSRPEDVYAERARAYIQMSRNKEAIADCNRALASKPNNMLALSNRSIAYKSLNNCALSLADANAYLNCNPNDDVVLCLRAYDLITLGRYEEAVTDCTQAIKIDASKSEAYAQRAEAYDFLHNSKKAIVDATEAIQLNRDPYAYAARGWALIQKGQYDQALSDLDTALQLQPKQPLALTVKARAMLAMGKTDLARLLCNEVLASHRTFPLALITRAEIYKSLGKKDLAQQDLQTLQLLKSGPAIQTDLKQNPPSP
jgi:serine/threonine protein kinase/thioredoxin-like negative regulator of GroEL